MSEDTEIANGWWWTGTKTFEVNKGFTALTPSALGHVWSIASSGTVTHVESGKNVGLLCNYVVGESLKHGPHSLYRLIINKDGHYSLAAAGMEYNLQRFVQGALGHDGDNFLGGVGSPNQLYGDTDVPPNIVLGCSSAKEEIEVTSDDRYEHGHLVTHSHGDEPARGGTFQDPHPLGNQNCDSSNCDVATHGVFQLNCDITVDGHFYEKGTVTTASLADVVAIGELTLNSLHTNLSQESLDSDLMRCYNTCHIQTSTPGSPAEPPPPTLVLEDEDEDDPSLCVPPPCPPGWIETDGCCYENTASPCTPGVDCEDEILIETEDPPDPPPPDPGTPPPDPIDCPGGPAVPEDEFTITGTGGSAVATGINECLVFDALHHTCAYLDYLVFDDCNAAIITIENLNDYPQYKEGAWVLVRGVAEIVTGVYPIFDVTATGFKLGPRNEGRTPLSGEVIQPPEGNSANSFHVMTFTSNLLTDGEFTGGEIGGWTVDQPQRIDHQALELGKFATGGWDNPAGAPPDYYDIVAQQDVYLDQNKTYRIQFVGDATVYANTDITGTLSDDSAFTLASGANWSSNVGTIDGTPVTMAGDEWPLITVPTSGTFTIYVKTYSDDPAAATPYAYFLDRIHIVECSV